MKGFDFSKAPYTHCGNCLANHRCRRMTGDTPIPGGYEFNFTCSSHELLTKAVELSRIPREYVTADKYSYIFDDSHKGYEEILKSFFKDPCKYFVGGNNVILSHPSKGTGKTYTAITLLIEFIYATCRNAELFDFENPLGLYVKFGAWANEHRNKYSMQDNSMADKVERLMRQMKTVPLLVLDDIGSGRITPFIRDLLYDILDYRKEDLKTTIFTTNFTVAELASEDVLGSMIVSRMLNKSSLIKLGGKDRRTTKF